MSQHFADAEDTLPIWDSLKKNLNARNAVTNNHLINSKDYGFVTPTILGNKQIYFMICEACHTFITATPSLYRIDDENLLRED
jgi:hypothetical protein